MGDTYTNIFIYIRCMIIDVDIYIYLRYFDLDIYIFTHISIFIHLYVMHISEATRTSASHSLYENAVSETCLVLSYDISFDQSRKMFSTPSYYVLVWSQVMLWCPNTHHFPFNLISPQKNLTNLLSSSRTPDRRPIFSGKKSRCLGN